MAGARTTGVVVDAVNAVVDVLAWSRNTGMDSVEGQAHGVESARRSCSSMEELGLGEAHSDATAVDDIAAFAARGRGLVSAVTMVVATY